MKQLKYVSYIIILIIMPIQLSSCKPGNDEDSQDTWTECPLTCDWKEGEVVFLRKHVHPIMAEYDRKIRLDIADQNSVYCPLPTNVGGRTLINIYWIDEKDDSGPMLLMRDRWGEYILDLKNKKTFMLIKPEPDRVFMGEITYEGSVINWGRNPKGELRVHIGGKLAKEISQYKIYGRSEYIGRIDGRKPGLFFIPSSDSKEETIEMILY